MRIVNPNFIVDTNLSDERGFNADLGIRGSLFNGLFYSDISCFYLEYDKILIFTRLFQIKILAQKKYSKINIF